MGFGALKIHLWSKVEAPKNRALEKQFHSTLHLDFERSSWGRYPWKFPYKLFQKEVQ